MENYYKKIFGNIYLSDLIFKHSHYKEWETTKDYTVYNKISNSIKTQDITSFERLLYGSCNYYGDNNNDGNGDGGNDGNGDGGNDDKISFNKSLFDDYFEIYFYVAIYNPSKYWYYNLSNTLTSIDLYYILRYKDMGFHRFSLIYSNYEQSFKDNQRYIIKDAAAGGNFEIYSFLLEQGYQHLDFSNIANIYNPTNDYYSMSICTTQPTSTRKGTQEFSVNCFFENGGNLEIFQNLCEFYKPTMRYYHYDRLFSWLSQQGQIEQIKFLFQYIQSLSVFYLNKGIENLVGYPLYFGNLELAEYLVNEVNNGETFNNIYKNGNELLNIKVIDDPIGSTNFMVWSIKKVYTMVFQFYWPRIIQLNPKLEHLGLKMTFLEQVNLVDFNFEQVNFNKELILLQLSEKKCYLPSFQEFQYLVENESLRVGVLNKLDLNFFNRLIIKQTTTKTTTTNLFNYNYVGYILNYCIGKFKSFKIPNECLDTNFEMIQYLWTNFHDHLTTTPVKSNFNSYNGDLESVKFFYSLFLSGSDKYKNNLFSLDNQVFEKAVINGHYEIVAYLFNLKKPTKVFPITNRKYGYGHFKVFQFLSIKEMEGSFENQVNPIYQLISDSIDNLEPRYVYHILENNIYNHTTRSNVSTNFIIQSINFESDLPLFKLLFSLYNEIFTSNQMMLYTLNKCNYSILEWYFQIGNIKPSTITDKQIQSNLTRQLLESTSKFSFFIENDPNLIYQCQHEIIQYSTHKKNPIILNSIFYNNSKLNKYIKDNTSDNLLYNDDFKLLLFVKTVIYSVSSIMLEGNTFSPSSANDDYLWMFNLKLNEIEKPKLKQLGKLLTVSKGNTASDNDCLLTIDQLNSIVGCFNKYFEPNLRNLKKKNLNVILVCHFIIGLNK